MIIELILIPLACLFITDISGKMDQFKWWVFYRGHSKDIAFREFRIKPFDCSMCLSAHVTWVYMLCIGNRNVFEIVVTALASGTIAAIINKIYSKI